MCLPTAALHAALQLICCGPRVCPCSAILMRAFVRHLQRPLLAAARSVRRSAAALLPVAAVVTVAASSRPVMAAPAAPASSASATTSAPAAGEQLAAAEDQECPWCTAMMAGGCASEFAIWRNCTKRVQKENDAAVAAGQAAGPSAARACMELFKPLDQCVRQPGADKRDYYRNVLPLDNLEPTPQQKIDDAVEVAQPAQEQEEQQQQQQKRGS